MDIQPTTANLSPMVSRQDISKAVYQLAMQINRDYANQNLLLIAVLNGSFIFLADLVRNLEIPVQLDFIRAICYENQTEPKAPARITSKPRIPIKGKNILVVEDIVDTGLTTEAILRYLNRKGANSIRLCALLNKSGRRQVEITVDYQGMHVPDKFLVGYGLDFAEEYRHLPDIYALEKQN